MVVERVCTTSGEEIRQAQLTLHRLATDHSCSPEERDIRQVTSVLTRLQSDNDRLREGLRDFGAVLGKRCEWLEYERRNGGNYEHLTTRLQECQHIAKKLAEAVALLNGEGS